MTTTTQMLQDDQPAGRPAVASSHLVPWVVVAIAVLLFLSVIVYGYVGAKGYYVLAPGNAPVVTASSSCRSVGGGSFALPNGTPCVQLIVPSGQAHQVVGSVMMVDVLEAKPTPIQFLAWQGAEHGFTFLRRVYGSDQFLPNAAVLGNGSASELGCVDSEQAVQATSAAPVAALRQLGYAVTESDLGAQIASVVVGTPAAAAGLECNDLVTAIDGAKVTTDVSLDNAIRSHHPGQTVAITLQRTKTTSQGQASNQTVTLTLHVKLAGTPALAGRPAQPNQAFLGVEPATRTSYGLPVKISANVGSIGGPSDGLALALGFIDTLSQGKLTNGLAVAATGEIDDKGNVYAIGGAAQKAVAVRRAGAKVFLVPTSNYAAAKSQAGSLKVLAVNNLAQALQDLKALGGELPSTPPGTTTAAGAVTGTYLAAHSTDAAGPQAA